MQCMIRIVSLIKTRHDECICKSIYPFIDNTKSINKFNELVRETLINLSNDYLEDALENPEEVNNDKIIELLEEAGHYPTLHEDYFGFVHVEGIREIEIDLEDYIAK